VFDEGYYTVPHCPPGSQLLYDIGHPDIQTNIIDPSLALLHPPVAHQPPIQKPSKLTPLSTVTPLPLNETTLPRRLTAQAASVQAWKNEDVMTVSFSKQRYNFTLEMTVPVSDAIDLGVIVQVHSNKPVLQILDCKKGTAAAKIPRWRSMLRYKYIYSINDVRIHSYEDYHREVLRLQQGSQYECIFTLVSDDTDKPYLSQDCTPQIYFDQLNVVHSHLAGLYEDHYSDADMWEPQVSKVALPPNRFCQSTLLKNKDWSQWEKSEWLQLDQYRRQNMFGKPMPQQPDQAVFNLVWTYLIKTDGTDTKKARCTCDGSPRSGMHHTLDHTYAACVDQNAARMFYAITAMKNNIVCGGDVSNAFAEAAGPKVIYYIKPDAQFRHWWTTHLHQSPIPPNHVIPILGNMQGHPEAPRLWSNHIHSILQSISLCPTTHEKCLYTGTIANHTVYLMRQVDDFAVSAPTLEIGNILLSLIDEHLTEPLKFQGIISYFNGVTLTQSNQYLQVSCRQYLDRVFERHGWQTISSKATSKSTPMTTDSQTLAQIETSQGPPTIQEARQLEKSMGFSYRAAIGELIYALVTCRPDISYATIKLSQYSINPSACHYIAVKNIFRYLLTTKDQGLTYWRPQINSLLPDLPLPIPITPQHNWNVNLDSSIHISPLYGFSDSE
jgi:hypothetical protein